MNYPSYRTIRQEHRQINYVVAWVRISVSLSVWLFLGHSFPEENAMIGLWALDILEQ